MTATDEGVGATTPVDSTKPFVTRVELGRTQLDLASGWVPSRRTLVALAAAILIALALLANLGHALRQMHDPGGYSGDLGSVASPTASSGAVHRVVGSWKSWDPTIGEPRPEPRTGTVTPPELIGAVQPDRGPVSVSPRVVALWWLVFDSLLFVPLFTVFVLGCARRRLRHDAEGLGAWLRWSSVFVVLYAAFDLAENLFTALDVFAGWPHLVTRVASGGKWLLLGLAVAPIALSFLGNGRSPFPRLAPALLRIRVVVTTVVLLAGFLLFLPGNVRAQLSDVMRTWTLDDDPWAFATATASMLLVSATIWLSGSLALRRPPAPRPQPDASETGIEWQSRERERSKRIAMYAVVGAAAAVSIAWHLEIAEWSVTIASIAVTFNALLRFALTRDDASDAQDAERVMEPTEDLVDGRRLLAVFTAAPPFVLALSYLQTADIVTGQKTIPTSIATTVALLSVAIALAALVERAEIPIATMGGSSQLDRLKTYVYALGGIGVVTLWVATMLGIYPLAWGWAVGAVGAFGMFLVGLCVVLTAIEHASWGWPRGMFRALRLRRVPLVSVAVVLVFLPGVFDDGVGYHAARVSGHGEHPRGAAPTIETLADQLAASAPGDMVTPLFVVASSGGGVRAAYWTLLAENCLFGGPASSPKPLGVCAQPASWKRVAMASGISGGSVGLAMYDAATRDAATVDPEYAFRDGFLDPTFAAMLYRDGVNTVLRTDGALFEDRAAVLERSFEARVPSVAHGLFASRTVSDLTPVVLLNSASLADGCRVNVSVLDLASTDDTQTAGKALNGCRDLPRTDHVDTSPERPLASTRDVADFVCDGEDLRFSTAALLSARFPVVSPTGALSACSTDNTRDAHVFTGDGGYVDSSAASPLVETLPALIRETEERLTTKKADSCVQPVVLQIDNGYADVTAAADRGRLRELSAPLAGTGATTGSRADAARQALALAARPRCAGVTRPTYLHMFPVARPGIEAPLGWSLSKAAREDLDEQIRSFDNVTQICFAKEWLVPGYDCPVEPNDRPQPRFQLPADVALGGYGWTIFLLLLVGPLVFAAAAAAVFLGTESHRSPSKRTST